MISCLHDHFLDDQLLSTPHLYFLYFGGDGVSALRFADQSSLVLSAAGRAPSLRVSFCRIPESQ